MMDGRPRKRRAEVARPGEGAWSSAPRPLRPTARPFPTWWQGFVGVPTLVGTLLWYLGARPPEWLTDLAVASMAFGTASFVALALTWGLGEALALRATEDDRRFSDAPEGLVEYPVEVALSDAHGTYGLDRGFVWFEDGLLTFNGAACSFVLSADDVFSREEARGEALCAGVPRLGLRLRRYKRNAVVRFKPLHGGGRRGFGAALRRFRKSAPSSDRPRQWPPLSPYGTTEKAYARTVGTPEAIGDGAVRG